MIEARVYRYPPGGTNTDGVLIMSRVFHRDDGHTLDSVLDLVDAYVVREQLNHDGDCVTKVRFGNPARSR
jgi:hypothetical protein